MWLIERVIHGVARVGKNRSEACFWAHQCGGAQCDSCDNYYNLVDDDCGYEEDLYSRVNLYDELIRDFEDGRRGDL